LITESDVLEYMGTTVAWETLQYVDKHLLLWRPVANLELSGQWRSHNWENDRIAMTCARFLSGTKQSTCFICSHSRLS